MPIKHQTKISKKSNEDDDITEIILRLSSNGGDV